MRMHGGQSAYTQQYCPRLKAAGGGGASGASEARTSCGWWSLESRAAVACACSVDRQDGEAAGAVESHEM